MKINIFLFLQIFLILKFTLWNVLSSTLSESKYYFFRFFPFSNLPLNFVCFLSLKMLKTFLWNKYFVSNLTITNCRLFLKFLIHNTFSTLTRTKARVDRLVTQNPHHLPWLRPIPEPISQYATKFGKAAIHAIVNDYKSCSWQPTITGASASSSLDPGTRRCR